MWIIDRYCISEIRYHESYWGYRCECMLSYLIHKFSRTRTYSNKGRPKKIIVIQLSITSFQKKHKFPSLTFKTGNFTLKSWGIFLCNCVWKISKHELPRIRQNGNQFNGSLLTIIPEKINIISVVSDDSWGIWPSRLGEALMHRTCAHATLWIFL